MINRVSYQLKTYCKNRLESRETIFSWRKKNFLFPREENFCMNGTTKKVWEQQKIEGRKKIIGSFVVWYEEHNFLFGKSKVYLLVLNKGLL